MEEKNNTNIEQISEDKSTKDLKWLDNIVSLMDDRFKIPGTNISFGLDSIIGLIPVIGDTISALISVLIFLLAIRHSRNGKVILLMTGNILLDYIIGLVPIIGDIFDISFKANRRNLNLIKEHIDKDKHKGSTVGLLIFNFALVIILLALIFYGLAFLFSYLFSL